MTTSAIGLKCPKSTCKENLQSAMTTLDVLRLEIQQGRSAGKTWQTIGDEYGINRAMARLLGLGYEPGKKVRAELGLPPSSVVVVIGGGIVPNGAQTIRALQCACGQWYIPNHPLRSHCFICRPARIKGRKP